MRIDWEAFTPWPALAGGILIGLAAAVLILGSGRVAGISGIVGGLLWPPRGGRGGARGPGSPGGDLGWRFAFVGGIVVTPWLYRQFSAWPVATIEAGGLTLVVAGLLVGLGTRYGAGCTSGHGVCGLSRLSPRSLVATLVFMAAGFVTVYVIRHLVAA